MKSIKIILGIICLIGVECMADDVLRGVEMPLNQKQTQSVGVAKDWINAKSISTKGANGSVNFRYGETLPSIVTAPLYITDIQLEAGEKIRDIQLGDSVRWIATPSVSGSGEEETSHVIVKPTDIGLQTTLYIYTDKRPYFLHLVSRKSDYMPIVGFEYPENTKKKWDEYYRKKEKKDEAKQLIVDKNSPPRNLDNLDFGYSIKGNVSWKPVRVYNDGVQTYIQMPQTMKFNESPALLVLDGSGKEKIVNYRLKGDRYIVDKLFDHAELINGVGGDQEKIEIIRNASENIKAQEKANDIASISGQR